MSTEMISKEELSKKVAVLKEENSALTEASNALINSLIKANVLDRTALKTANESSNVVQNTITVLTVVAEYLQQDKSRTSGHKWGKKVDASDLRDMLHNAYSRFESNKMQSVMNSCLSVKSLSKKLHQAGAYKNEASAASAINRFLREERMIGFKSGLGTRSTWRIPEYQFNQDSGLLHPGIKEVCNIFHDNGFSVHKFLTSPHSELKNRTPLALIEEASQHPVLAKQLLDSLMKLAKGDRGYPLEEIQ